MRQLVYTMFISHTPTSFHWWCKDDLVKQQEVLKYHENDYLQNFLFLLVSLLVAKFVKKSLT